MIFRCAPTVWQGFLGLSQTFLQPVMLMFEVPHGHTSLNGEGEPHAQGKGEEQRMGLGTHGQIWQVG